jgi:hypothetical protein
MLNGPVGAGQQNGAVMALTNLALENDFLLETAIETLKGITIRDELLLKKCKMKLMTRRKVLMAKNSFI